MHFFLSTEALPPFPADTNAQVSMTDTLINRDPEILAGTPVFAGTRVPVRTLFEYLQAGDPLHEFLYDYPAVTRDQAVAVLDRAGTILGSISAATT